MNYKSFIDRTMRRVKLSSLIIALATFFLPMGVNAQIADYFIPRYITGDLGGGLQSIQFSPHDGQHKVGMGFRFNAGCVFMIDDNWGVNTGVGLSSYRSRVIYDSIMESSYALDTLAMPGKPLDYEFRTYYSDFSERQNILQLEVPITAFCQYPIINDRFDVIGKAGFKLGFPLSTKYCLIDGNYETRGYYPYTKVEYHDMANHGFEKMEADKEKGKSKVNSVNVSLLLEGGMSYKFNKALRAFASVYFSYCLSNLHKETVDPILSPDKKYNGTLSSSQIDRASLMSVGLSAGVIWDYHITFYRSKRKFR